MMFRTHTPKQWKERLQKTGTSDEGWTIHYHDPETDERWVEYFPYQEDRARQAIFGRRTSQMNRKSFFGVA